VADLCRANDGGSERSVRRDTDLKIAEKMEGRGKKRLVGERSGKSNQRKATRTLRGEENSKTTNEEGSPKGGFAKSSTGVPNSTGRKEWEG